VNKWVVSTLLVVALLIAAAGLYMITRFEGPPIDTTAALVPAEATAYASFFVDPSSDQKKLLRDTVEGAREGLDAASLIEDVLDRVTRPFGLPYEDVAPWIDRQMALFVLPQRGEGVIVEIADKDAARRALRGVGGQIFGDHAVFGDAEAVRAVGEVAAAGPEGSIEGSDSFLYPQAIRDAPRDRLAVAYATGGDLTSRGVDLPDGLNAAELPLGISQGNAITLRASEEGLVFDGRSYSDGAILLAPSRQMDLADAAGDAWLAAEIPNLSAAVEALDLELRQAARATGAPSSEIPRFDGIEGTDRALFWVAGRGIADLSVGLVANTDSEKDSARLARSLASLPGLPPRLEFDGRRISAAFGDNSSGRTLSDESRFIEARAWLDGLEPIGFLDLKKAGTFPATLALLVGTQAGRTAGYELPGWLSEVDRIVVGLDGEAGPTHWRLVVSLRR